VAVTAERTTRFPSAVATVMAVVVVEEAAAWWCRWRRSRTATAVKVEEERDNLVPECGSEGRADSNECVDLAVAVATLRRAASKSAREILAA
jgi:hypothetical protein